MINLKRSGLVGAPPHRYTMGMQFLAVLSSIIYYLKKKYPKPLAVTEEVVLTEQELPAVEHMATAVQVGGADLVFQALGKIAQWIEVNGYKMAGPYREIVLEMDGEGALGNSVIEIQMPVDKK